MKLFNNKSGFGMNKKGALTDIFLWMIVAFTIAVVSGIFIYIASTTQASLLENSDSIQQVMGSRNATTVINDTVGQVVIAYQSLKWITAMLIIGMMLSILISGFLVKIHPVFFVPYFIISIIAVIVSAPMSNAYETIYTNELLASSFVGFWGQSYIFLHLPTWVTIIMVLAGIVMFINVIREGQGGYV